MYCSGLQQTVRLSVPDKLASIMIGITGTHILLYSDNPDADCAFFRDILGFRSVDAGQGWLIFAMPQPGTGSLCRYIQGAWPSLQKRDAGLTKLLRRRQRQRAWIPIYVKPFLIVHDEHEEEGFLVDWWHRLTNP
jgi:catechol 2,3-dioxygenase-like lactoylglutathione lyase family enzyme